MALILLTATVALNDLDTWISETEVNSIEGFSYVSDLGAIVILYT